MFTLKTTAMETRNNDDPLFTLLGKHGHDLFLSEVATVKLPQLKEMSHEHGSH